MALLLCPACTHSVGARVGIRTVDIYDDSVMSEILHGDQLRIRHDKVKMVWGWEEVIIRLISAEAEAEASSSIEFVFHFVCLPLSMSSIDVVFY